MSSDDDAQDRGDVIQITFDPTEQRQRAGVNKQRVGTVEELRIAFVTYLKEHDPAKLECSIERYLHDRGHQIIWTPPYCPE